MSFEIIHLGAEKCVTGSCHLFRTNSMNILIDCGMVQGNDTSIPIPKKNILQFDETPVLKASINSLNISKIENYLQRLELSPMDEGNLSQELINLSVLCRYNEQSYPTLAGLLAFARNPQQFFPSYGIRCGAYNGTDFVSETIREVDLTGTFDEIIEDAIGFSSIRREFRYRYCN